MSLQREILDRLAKKRPKLDYSSQELLDRYEHANRLIKDRRTKTLCILRFVFLLSIQEPVLNLLSGKKVPIAEFENLESELKAKVIFGKETVD